MCESFLLRSKQNNEIVVSRSMEFPPFPSIKILGATYQIDWNTCYVPAATVFNSRISALKQEVGSTLISEHNYISTTGFSKDLALVYGAAVSESVEHPLLGTFSSEGINVHGLSASLLTYDSNMKWAYNSPSTDVNIYWFLFIDYVLGMFKTVNELKMVLAAGNLCIFGSSFNNGMLNQPCHYITHDKAGDC